MSKSKNAQKHQTTPEQDSVQDQMNQASNHETLGTDDGTVAEHSEVLDQTTTVSTDVEQTTEQQPDSQTETVKVEAPQTVTKVEEKPEVSVAPEVMAKQQAKVLWLSILTVSRKMALLVKTWLLKPWKLIWL